ncbi:sensor histidine kinase [Cellulomonas fimi]|uniref:histidine kinase n=1 Tax=Cellulomonas fimi (strain ATCC 484 / DSM 20113 / JCM 1341 / CCUG 24087 / LMG 16345 / NBRC 15513 / NCIMB 8980 / NCTC 7547 / NRS-133) TaxID=590998 RepID=F4H5M1_CELFA|nr:HAMP domain-containing sensor histidine kinase [Cellulomonas fimi]AEE44345.1 integral membrane sensor signal transduction histidine kinase [Cellulomonas fimi ATCC 484]NNH08130.1 HAMP domain-containing histidine kinase [Cellulomonas fimi]VEH26169.1 Probable sensor histidine kinase TcrY [Cellulomonas fimi]
MTTRRPRSIRGRVVAAVTAVVLVGLLGAGLASVVALRDYLLDRTDDRLREAAQTVSSALAVRGPTVVREPRLRLVVEGAATDVAVHLVSEGRVVETIATGGVAVPRLEAAAVDALHEAPGWLPGGTRRAYATDTPGLTVESVDGDRVAVDTVVLVADTADDQRTVARLVGIEAAAGALAAGGTLMLAWWTVGVGLAPLRRMARSAERIAAGDRSERLPREPLAETRALAAALDDALAERERAERRMREFTADAAHELRTPLTSVHGWADLYLQGGLAGDALDRAMERVVRETTRMRHLVDQLALLARLDADVPLARDDVDLRALVDDVVTDLDVLAPDREVRWGRPSAPVVVVGDRERLVQVVQNLVGNVLRHTPSSAGLTVRLDVRDGGPGAGTAGGSASGAGDTSDSDPGGGRTVRNRPTARTAVLVVADDGPGVPPDLAPRVFERFVREARDTSGASSAGADTSDGGALREGSGLGLAIVAAVVRAHDGTVRLDSAPGAGTTVTVELPTR